MFNSVSITCIIRIAIEFNPGSAEKDNVETYETMLWFDIEAGVAILCCCLPTMAPLVSGVSSILPSVKSWFSSLLSRTRGGTTTTEAWPGGRGMEGGSTWAIRSYETSESDGASMRWLHLAHSVDGKLRIERREATFEV